MPYDYTLATIDIALELQMEKYPMLRDQVEKIVVQHGRKGEAKSKEQVLSNGLLDVCVCVCVCVCLEEKGGGGAGGG